NANEPINRLKDLNRLFMVSRSLTLSHCATPKIVEKLKSMLEIGGPSPPRTLSSQRVAHDFRSLCDLGSKAWPLLRIRCSSRRGSAGWSKCQLKPEWSARCLNSAQKCRCVLDVTAFLGRIRL